jgi:hypothetical protein
MIKSRRYSDNKKIRLCSKDTDGFESGKLYAALRNVALDSYADKELDNTYKK